MLFIRLELPTAFMILSLVLTPIMSVGQIVASNDSFLGLLNEIIAQCPAGRSGVYAKPTENDLADWNRVLRLFTSGNLDSCKKVLARYDYTVHLVKDPITGNTYDVIREKYPIRRGWGTFIYNRNHAKRLYIHVNHPLDDPGALVLSAELFRRLKAEWMLIAGTSRYALHGSVAADVGQATRSIFEQLHEALSGLTHVSISVHSFNETAFKFPVSATDLIISNGKTSDEQWGISRLSLAVRDSIRASGFQCGLAMYDSGYARHAGGWNQQGIFSNDSVGFGHWLYFEVSAHIRENAAERQQFVAAADRAFSVTGGKVSQQVNQSFGLVSPRVIKVDSKHGLLFEPPSSSNVYRVVSFDNNDSRADSSGVRVGRWLDLFGSGRGVASISRLDSSTGDLVKQFRMDGRGRTLEFARIVETPAVVSSRVRAESEVSPESSPLVGDDQGPSVEPLQVHRIPLEPVLASTYSGQTNVEKTVFRWEGMLPGKPMQGVPLFEMSSAEPSIDNIEGKPKFYIPLISSTYGMATGRFIGVRMTDVLMDEIARLVTQYQVSASEVGLMAEESERGEYYLRLFPNVPDRKSKQGPR